jgi:hypothetical protein
MRKRREERGWRERFGGDGKEGRHAFPPRSLIF